MVVKIAPRGRLLSENSQLPIDRNTIKDAKSGLMELSTHNYQLTHLASSSFNAVNVYKTLSRIPMALPHLSIRLDRTKYWFKESSFEKVFWFILFPNSKNLSTGRHVCCISLEVLINSSFSLINALSLSPNNGFGTKISCPLNSGLQKDEGFLFACKHGKYNHIFNIYLIASICSLVLHTRQK